MTDYEYEEAANAARRTMDTLSERVRSLGERVRAQRLEATSLIIAGLEGTDGAGKDAIFRRLARALDISEPLPGGLAAPLTLDDVEARAAALAATIDPLWRALRGLTDELGGEDVAPHLERASNNLFRASAAVRLAERQIALHRRKAGE